MPSRPIILPRDRRPLRQRSLGHFFLRGIMVLAPAMITFSIVLWLFRKLDGWVNPYVSAPGVGLLSMIALILLVGWVSSFSFVQRTFKIVDRLLEQMPGISFIYSSVRDFFEAFAGRKRRFTQAVLVNVFSDDIWIVGFLTDETAGNFELGEDYVSVYVPQAYNVAGQLYVVPRNRVRPIEGHTSPDVMKYAVTGGAVEINANASVLAAEKAADASSEPVLGTHGLTPGPKPA